MRQPAGCRTRPLHQNTAKVNPLILAFSNSDYVHTVPHGLFGLLSRRSLDLELPPGGVPTTVVGRDEPVEVIAACAVFLTAVVALIVPLWTLAVVDDMFKKLGVITAFLLFFLVVLVCGTLARPFEVLAATAG